MNIVTVKDSVATDLPLGTDEVTQLTVRQTQYPYMTKMRENYC